MVIQLRYEYIPSPVTKLQTKKEQTPTLVAKLNNFPSLPYTNTYEEITSDFKKTLLPRNFRNEPNELGRKRRTSVVRGSPPAKLAPNSGLSTVMAACTELRTRLSKANIQCGLMLCIRITAFTCKAFQWRHR